MKETRKEQLEVEIEAQTKILEKAKADFREFQKVEIQKEEDSKKQIQAERSSILKIINNKEIPEDITLKQKLQKNLNTKSYERKPFADCASHSKITHSKREIAELQTELYSINNIKAQITKLQTKFDHINKPKTNV